MLAADGDILAARHRRTPRQTKFLVRGLRLSLLVVLALALGSVDARAAAYEILYEPQSPRAGEQVTFHAERVNPGQGGGDSFTWDFGDGATGTGLDSTHVYAGPGSYTVALSVTDSDGITVIDDTTKIEVKPENRPPSATFTFVPASPVAGEDISFTGQASDPDGDTVSLSWVFGDGATATGASPTHAYAIAGSYTVGLTATDQLGAHSATFETLSVGPPIATSPPNGGSPPGSELPGDPVTPPPTATRPQMMSPFPVVRMAGTVLRRGALVRILSVRAPRGARLSVRCRGGDCPVRSLTRTSETRIVRFRRFERRLAAGTELELFVRQPGKIGKYTRFVIRGGKPPSRVDRCLVPGRARPVSCGER
ncbi:MAG TPA: PKD domain-containing protein [Thermoleophilaceae bacterium]